MLRLTSLYVLLVLLRVVYGQIPSCAQPCFLSAIGSSGCASTDTACICSFIKSQSTTTSCLISSCNTSDLQQVTGALNDLCKGAGVSGVNTVVSSSPTPTTSTTTSTSTSTTERPASATTTSIISTQAQRTDSSSTSSTSTQSLTTLPTPIISETSTVTSTPTSATTSSISAIPNSASTSSSSSSISTGVKVGIGIGSAVGVTILALLAYIAFLLHKRSKQDPGHGGNGEQAGSALPELSADGRHEMEAVHKTGELDSKIGGGEEVKWNEKAENKTPPQRHELGV